ncbi:MAG: nucleoside phosphorylase [Isosphaeraceae bacterium]
MSPTLPAPGPADIGLVVALPIEVAPLLVRLENSRKYRGVGQAIIEGEIQGRVLAIALTGPGRLAASRGTRTLLDGHRPRWVISAGFAGALNPQFRRGDLAVPVEIVDELGGRIALDVKHPDSGPDAPRSGRLLTVDRIIRTAGEKAELHAKSGADLVDMETWAVAELCGHRGVRFLSVRIVSDDARTDLPPEILNILGKTGGYRVGAAVGALWKRPSSFFDLMTLREHAHQAADKLGHALIGMLPRLS